MCGVLELHAAAVLLCSWRSWLPAIAATGSSSLATSSVATGWWNGYAVASRSAGGV